MKCVVGLGNPGKRYSQTRHNVGYMVLSALRERLHLEFSDEGVAFLAEGKVAGLPFLLVRPASYMNVSGQAVSCVVRRYCLSAYDLLIVHDDMDLPFGKVRFRRKGSAGGHKGIASVIDHLGTEDFARLKIGVGRPPEGVDSADYVLQEFTGEEVRVLPELLSLASGAVLEFLSRGLDSAMDKHNGPKTLSGDDEG